MDQPERRGSTSLLGGGGKQHPLFGLSCNFSELSRKFAACEECLSVAKAYIATASYENRMIMECNCCYSYSLKRLMMEGKRQFPVLPWLAADAPGYLLTTRPGVLSMDLLIAGWQYAANKFVVEHQWTQREVEAYFNLLCINTATTEQFTSCCRNTVLLQDMVNRPEEYPEPVLAFIRKDQLEHPTMYVIPTAPSAWSIGTVDNRVETIMHLAMNTQKSSVQACFTLGCKFGSWNNSTQTVATTCIPSPKFAACLCAGLDV